MTPKPTAFLVLYSGADVESARMVAVTADPEIVRDFTDRMLERDQPTYGDPVADAVAQGRRQALQLVRDEIRPEAAEEEET